MYWFLITVSKWLWHTADKKNHDVIHFFLLLSSRVYTQLNQMDTFLHLGQYKKRVYEFDERRRLCLELNYLIKMRKYRVLSCSSVVASGRRVTTLFHAVNSWLKSGVEKDNAEMEDENGARLNYYEMIRVTISHESFHDWSMIWKLSHQGTFRVVREYIYIKLSAVPLSINNPPRVDFTCREILISKTLRRLALDVIFVVLFCCKF